MKISYSYFLLLFLTNSIWLTNTTVLSLNLWKKDNTYIATIGEDHCDFDSNLQSPFVIADKQQAAIIKNYLERWAHASQPTAFLIESSENFIEAYRDYYATALQAPQLIYTGMHVALPMFAHTRNYKHGSITFINTDKRTKEICESVQIIANFSQISDQLKISLSSLAAKLNTDANFNKNFFYGPAAKYTKLAALTNCNSANLESYLNTITTLATVTHDQVPDAYTTFMLYAQKTQQFIDTHARGNYQQTIGDFLWNIAQEHGLSYLLQNFGAVLQPLASLMADIGVQIALNQAIAEYNSIVIFGGQHHICQTNATLKALGFNAVMALGAQEELNVSAIDNSICSPAQLEEFLDIYTKQAMPDSILNTCGYCNSIESSKNSYKHCGNCKKIHYCSRDCQSKHWKEHKAYCKK